MFNCTYKASTCRIRGNTCGRLLYPGDSFGEPTTEVFDGGKLLLAPSNTERKDSESGRPQTPWRLHLTERTRLCTPEVGCLDRTTRLQFVRVVSAFFFSFFFFWKTQPCVAESLPLFGYYLRPPLTPDPTPTHR